MLGGDPGHCSSALGSEIGKPGLVAASDSCLLRSIRYETMKEPYVSLATKKKSGDWVWTPVWFAESSGGQSIYIFSAADAGKVKRLKNFEAVQIAPCTISGRITGESKDASGQLVHDDTEIANAYTLLRAKYGWQIKVLDFFSRIAGNINKRQMIRVDF
jgi:PPOX class probable F420-dependent enzyme